VNLSPVLEQLVRLEIEQGAGYNDTTTTASPLSAPSTANNDNYYKYYCSTCGWLFGDNWDSSTQQPSVVKIDAEPPRYVSCYMSPSQRLACEQMASEMARRRALSRMAPLLPMTVNPVLASDGTFGFLAPRPNPSYYHHQDDLMTMKEIYCRNGGAGQPMAPLWSGVPLCYDVPAFGGAGP
ncbi:hypothetical protein D917_10306, partial [Trichinella nativa]